MTLELHAVSRDNLYEATATYNDGTVIVKKGSRIRTEEWGKYRPKAGIAKMRADKQLVDEKGILLKDVSFNSLSTSASFVTGCTSNGMLRWKTPDGKYVKFALKGKVDQ